MTVRWGSMRAETGHRRFIDSVYRRLVVIRFAENLGVCLAAASAVCLFILPVLMFRDESSLPVVAVMTGIAFLAAIAVTIKRWPTKLQAASEADRQLKLADLLSS